MPPIPIRIPTLLEKIYQPRYDSIILDPLETKAEFFISGRGSLKEASAYSPNPHKDLADCNYYDPDENYYHVTGVSILPSFLEPTSEDKSGMTLLDKNNQLNWLKNNSHFIFDIAIKSNDSYIKSNASYEMRNYLTLPGTLIIQDLIPSYSKPMFIFEKNWQLDLELNHYSANLIIAKRTGLKQSPIRLQCVLYGYLLRTLN